MRVCFINALKTQEAIIPDNVPERQVIPRAIREIWGKGAYLNASLDVCKEVNGNPIVVFPVGMINILKDDILINTPVNNSC